MSFSIINIILSLLIHLVHYVIDIIYHPVESLKVLAVNSHFVLVPRAKEDVDFITLIVGN